ncbi:MAG: acetyl-CoA carboxylase biotin carboxyl carrier protein [Rhodoferax sp.]|jgi:biotin carboxyl carrier protein|nr:acetyl-CoA carboxylase biotin carboxyl carrier protein [Rhodoferax sp.]
MPRQFKVTVNGREYDVAVLEVTAGATSSASPMAMPGAPAPMMAAPSAPASAAPAAAAAGAGDEVAQMGGVVVQVDVKVGQTVAVGDKLLVLEAMKMKNHLLASRAGKVTRIMVAAGDPVEGGQPVMTIQ